MDLRGVCQLAGARARLDFTLMWEPGTVGTTTVMGQESWW